MAESSKNSDASKLFREVFTEEGLFEEVTTRCDVITAASLVGSSKLHLDSAKDSATQHASLPFGLPCVLHSHPTKIPWECNEYFEGKGTSCKLTPLDRFSSNAVLPNCMGKQWVGANGDWIATAGHEYKWELVNVYTHRRIPLPPVLGLEVTPDPFTFTHRGRTILLRKIAVCQVPTAAEEYSDLSVVAIFDYLIAILDGEDFGWTVLENQFQRYFRYIDAIIHQGLVFAATDRGTVYAWNPLLFGPMMLESPPESLLSAGHFDGDNPYDPSFWFLARSVDGSRLLLVNTHGVPDEEEYSGGDNFTGVFRDDHSVNRCGRTVSTYVTGFGCKVFSMDTSRLHPANKWEAIADLGAYSLFLGVNYPIKIAVGSADVAPGYLTRSNCVYTSHHAVGLGYRPCPEICRFSLNGEDAAVGFSTNIQWEMPETPLWFIPSFANALHWN